MELTYDEIVDISHVKCIAGSTIGYSLPSSFYETSYNNLLLKSLLPEDVKVKITFDDIRL